ncbi:hypothetical protein IWQ47_000247 [Aquimarina sp. EL_43]|nr:hypothetical protein [Aquimarina sp. EL_35]MBG6150125.1 hypothetical protein [Aquimarina sp. EL_32]MBG6167189.1 hypothetical protein [Aquimarina sp. EL_43]
MNDITFRWEEETRVDKPVEVKMKTIEFFDKESKTGFRGA